MSNKIFYFTGTGNSLQIAKDISDGLGETELIPINNETKTEVLSDAIVGIVFPIYCWCMPLVVEKFVRQLRISDSTYLFAVENYGGTPIGAIGQIRAILNKKGIKLNAGFTIQMPGNYIVMYGALNKNLQNKRFETEKLKIAEILRYIKERKDKSFSKSRFLLDVFFSNMMHKSLTKIHPMDKNFYTNENCISCGLCERKCPVNNIKIIDGKPEWQHNCERCLACIQHCPVEAINYGEATINRKRYMNPNV